MIQEDKAEAYDKVRKKIAIKFGSNVADEFFAEFEGSKDEEIRKALLEMVHDTTGDELWVDYNVHKEDALVWLENIPVTIDHEKREGFHLGYRACLERQGEQKPEENKGNIGGISAEWSKEDEVFLDDILCKLEHDLILNKDEKDWLKSLRPQSKQEWSEEDEQHIDSLLKRLDALCRNKFERTRFAISEDRDWLKSLRPQNRWKPSKEQMEALNWHIGNTSVGSWQYKATKELMADLKKLKEEQV